MKYPESESPSKYPMGLVHKQFHVTSVVPERNRGEHVWKCWKRIERKLKTVLAALLRASSGSATLADLNDRGNSPEESLRAILNG
jgi:hypothetical protein